MIELGPDVRVARVDAFTHGAAAALLEELVRCPWASFAYVIDAGRDTVIGLGTPDGAVRALRRLTGGRARRVRVYFVAREVARRKGAAV